MDDATLTTALLEGTLLKDGKPVKSYSCKTDRHGNALYSLDGGEWATLQDIKGLTIRMYEVSNVTFSAGGDHTHAVGIHDQSNHGAWGNDKQKDTVIRKLKCQSCGYEESDLTKGRCSSCGDHLYMKDMIEIPKFNKDDYVEISTLGDPEPKYIKVRNTQPRSIFRVPKK